ncbi:MAG: hypothetical protein A2X64_07485 [Ignavibacteria bacterium GWF2_33_9]|nr:MAG: hypothetical protein A2X64_07485 [Ignavibacteria bacterium GWF2_33_9]
METLHIDIINPKAKNLLLDLAKLDLIKIKSDTTKSELLELLAKLRNKSLVAPSLDEIAKEVKLVRKARYEK